MVIVFIKYFGFALCVLAASVVLGNQRKILKNQELIKKDLARLKNRQSDLILRSDVLRFEVDDQTRWRRKIEKDIDIILKLLNFLDVIKWKIKKD